jgi:hypothetical protein
MIVEAKARHIGDNMDENSMKLLIDRLEYIRARKPLYIADDLLPIVNFIHGFNAACHALGLPSGHDISYEEAVQGRGWKSMEIGFEEELKRHGLTDDEIADELLAIEIEAWKHRYNRLIRSTPMDKSQE